MNPYKDILFGLKPG